MEPSTIQDGSRTLDRNYLTYVHKIDGLKLHGSRRGHFRCGLDPAFAADGWAPTLRMVPEPCKYRLMLVGGGVLHISIGGWCSGPSKAFATPIGCGDRSRSGVGRPRCRMQIFRMSRLQWPSFEAGLSRLPELPSGWWSGHISIPSTIRSPMLIASDRSVLPWICSVGIAETCPMQSHISTRSRSWSIPRRVWFACCEVHWARCQIMAHGRMSSLPAGRLNGHCSSFCISRRSLFCSCPWPRSASNTTRANLR